MSTILEVSKLAGVSKATVSRVINGNKQVKEENRERVLDAIASLNFRPSKTAQALAKRKTNTVAVVFPESASAQWGVLLPIIARELQRSQINLTLVCCPNDATSEYNSIIQLQGQCDAVLLYSRVLSEKHIQKLSKELPIPLVVMNRNSHSLKCPTVSIDHSQLMHKAMRHLIAKGHRHIAYISGPTDNPNGQARMKGYIEALYNKSLIFNPLLVATTDNQAVGGYQACLQLLELKTNFTAIACFSDQIAIGALKALKESKINVPKQVSIVSIGNSDVCEFSVPKLTSVSEPTKTMALETSKLLIDVCNKKGSPRTIILSGSVSERESTRLINSFAHY